MLKFRYLPHTADAKFVSYGKTFRKALENSALALLSLMVDVNSASRVRCEPSSILISESADSEAELVWFTLQDILSKVDTHNLSAYAFRVVSLKMPRQGRMRLQGRLIHKRTSGNFALMSVKAVTPHDLTVRRSKGKVSIWVVVDV